MVAARPAGGPAIGCCGQAGSSMRRPPRLWLPTSRGSLPLVGRGTGVSACRALPVIALWAVRESRVAAAAPAVAVARRLRARGSYQHGKQSGYTLIYSRRYGAALRPVMMCISVLVCCCPGDQHDVPASIVPGRGAVYVFAPRPCVLPSPVYAVSRLCGLTSVRSHVCAVSRQCGVPPF